MNNNLFLDSIRQFIFVSTDLECRLLQIAQARSLSRKEQLQATGQRCGYIHFVKNGLLRGYYEHNDKEVTSWFSREGEFATCYYSFITRGSSLEYIEALEPSSILSISYQDLQQLYIDYPETERLGRLLMEAYYIKLEHRLQSLQFNEGRRRYEHLLLHNPELLQRAPLGAIASYLGIAQETLSRIRAERG